jgi:ketosteroid isomerase-like protein
MFMPRITLVAALTLALGFVAFSPIQGQTKPHRDRRTEDTILRLERETMEAIRNKDGATLSRILADDFVLRSPAGADLNKTEFLKLAQSIPVKILSVKGENLKVNVYGQTAVLTGVQRSTTLGDDGREETSAGAFTDIFIKRQGRWLLVLAYNVELPAPPPSQPSLPSRK